MAEKCTMAQVIQRVDTVFRLLVDGQDAADVAKFCQEEWGIGESGAYDYIKKARAQLDSLTKGSQEDHLRFVLENLRSVLKATIEDRNHNCTLGALSQIAKICGLEKHTVIIRDEHPDLTLTEVAEEIERRESITH